MKLPKNRWWLAPTIACGLLSAQASADFSVRNGQLLDGNGNPFVMRGINFLHTWYKPRTQQTINDIATTGSNTIRVVLASGARWTPRDDGAAVRQIIGWAKANKIVTVLEVHDSTGWGDDAGAAHPSTSVDYFLSADIRAAIQGQEDYVVINFANEFVGNNTTSQWAGIARDAISRLRAGGLRHTIMVDAPNWGQDWSNTMRNNATGVFNSDPLRNTIFSVHMYESYGSRSQIEPYMQAFKNNGLHLVVGEFGADHKGSNVDEDTIMWQSEVQGFGYLAWSWSGNDASTASLDIVNGFNVNSLTNWGSRLINGANGIRSTSRTATVFNSPPASSSSVSSTTGNLAQGKLATSSCNDDAGRGADKAVDGSGSTRWSSCYNDSAWITVDLGSSYNINRVNLNWEAAFGRGYELLTSQDGNTWTNVYTTTTGDGGVDNINLTGTGRYLRLRGTARATQWGYSLWELQVFGSPAASSAPASSVPAVSSSAPSSAVRSSAISSVVIPGSSAAPTSQFNCSARQTGTWSGGGQFEGTVTNTAGSASNWTVYLTFSQPVSNLNVWNAVSTPQGGNTYRLTNASWNGNLGTNASTSFGLTANFPAGTSVRCSGSIEQPRASSAPSSVAISSVAPSSVPRSSSSVATTSSIAPSSSSAAITSSAAPSSLPAVSSSRASSSVSSITPPERLDNPFVDAQWYVDPIWSAKAQAETGGSRVAGYNTAVWMDRIGAISPTDGSFGLRDHLDAALAQKANVIQVVVYDLPNRDCHALASNGELKQGAEGSARYRTEYVDAIASIFADPKYSSLRIIAIIEPDSLPNLVTNLSDPDCQLATDPTHGYAANTRYTLSKLYPITNVYSYVDIGHSGWLGWPDNFGPAVTLIGNTIKSATGGVNSVAGFVSNTSGYTPLYEPFLDSLANSAFSGGGQTRQAAFYEWNPHFSEVGFVQAWRNAMINNGFPSSIGMLVDTSRNGWGGPNRPTSQSTSSQLNTFVDQSRIDRRTHRGNWCNQRGGIGERPRVAPVAGIDAYVWVKPPGESDGAASLALSFDPQDPAKGFDRMCDPTYNYNPGSGNNVDTGALPGAPVAGRWFKEGFQVLLQNAYPPLQ